MLDSLLGSGRMLIRLLPRLVLLHVFVLRRRRVEGAAEGFIAPPLYVFIAQLFVSGFWHENL